MKVKEFTKFIKQDFNVAKDYKNRLVSCKNCLRRTKTDEDYMKPVDCFGNKIDWNCLITIEEENKYTNIKCEYFINKEDE